MHFNSFFTCIIFLFMCESPSQYLFLFRLTTNEILLHKTKIKNVQYIKETDFFLFKGILLFSTLSKDNILKGFHVTYTVLYHYILSIPDSYFFKYLSKFLIFIILFKLVYLELIFTCL